MELRLLRAFLTVTEVRHFGRAADALHVSQPALSKQIAALEAVLGGRLFERGRHGADLTAFGESFRPGALSLIGEADDLLIRAREASSGQRGHLRVGLGLSVLEGCTAVARELPVDEPGRRRDGERLVVV
jgi:DNA-binding transcriptional LysR family regulator